MCGLYPISFIGSCSCRQHATKAYASWWAAQQLSSVPFMLQTMEFTSSVPSVVHACVRVFVRELSSCIDTATRFQAARRTQTVRTLTVDSWLFRIAGPEKAKAADQA